MMLDIVYEDEDLIVVNKPIGLSSQPDPKSKEDLYTMVMNHCNAHNSNEKVSLGLLQRLDKPVSGLVLLTKSEAAKKYFAKPLKDTGLRKVYRAIVEGKIENSNHLEQYIEQVRGNRSVVSRKQTSRSKIAILEYTPIESMNSEEGIVTMIEINLLTGRHHQIRAQMAFAGHPLIGDTKYNPSYQTKKGWYDIALMCYRLEFLHPSKQIKMVLISEKMSHPFDGFSQRENL